MFHSLGLLRVFSIRTAALDEFIAQIFSHYWCVRSTTSTLLFCPRRILRRLRVTAHRC